MGGYPGYGYPGHGGYPGYPGHGGYPGMGITIGIPRDYDYLE
jgi:hypothetical protein